MASTIKLICISIPLLFFVIHLSSSSVVSSAAQGRTFRRIHLPFLGIGPRCDGCPQHFCDDDDAIIHGYCCGCAKFFDNIPVRCSPELRCPLNTYDLCEQYEYMMHCCCKD